MKFNLKRTVTIFVAIAIGIAALFFPQSSNATIKAGKGDGKNEKVETIEEAHDVISSAISLMDKSSNVSRGISDRDLKYDSFTMTFKRDTKVGYYVDGVGTVTSAKVYSQHYYDEDDEVYIVGEGIIIVDSRTSLDSQTAYIRVKAEMYFSDDYVLMNIHDFDVSSGSVGITPAMKRILTNKWIDLSDDGAGLESSVNKIMDTNMDFLELLEDYVEKCEDEDSFKKENSVYTMKSKTLKEFLNEVRKLMFGSPNFDVDTDGELEVDLSKLTEPEIRLNIKYNLPSSYATTEYRQTNGYYGYGYEQYETHKSISGGDSYEDLVYKFSNIDNTEITFDIDEEEIFTADEIDEMMENIE